MFLVTVHPMAGVAALLRPAFASLLILAAGVIAAVDARAADRTLKVAENAGRVCIMRGHTGAGAVVMFRPRLGCLSSGCTTPVEQSFHVNVRQHPDQAIEMTSRFVVSIATGDVVCTADCGGVGTASSTLTQLPPGTYHLRLGGEEIGQLDTERLKGDPFNRICFGSDNED